MTNQVDTLGVPFKVGDKAIHVWLSSSTVEYEKVFILGFTPKKVCYKRYLNETQRKNSEDHIAELRYGPKTYTTPERFKENLVRDHNKTVPHHLIKLDWEGEPGWTLEKQIEWAEKL